MIAVDTNLLVYAHREDSAHHEIASEALVSLVSEPSPWALPMQCLIEFVGIVTHPRIYAPPTPLDVALEAVDALVRLDTTRVLCEGPEDWPVIAAAFRRARVRGPRVHDARVGAVCRDHGVTEILTADRRFPRIAGLRVHDLLA